MRILITGSRSWADAEAIRDAIAAAIAGHDGPVTIVHGGAKGADQLAAALAPTFGPHVTTERWPAAWDLHGVRAGVLRNQEMVDAGASLVLAFLVAGLPCRGTRDCVRRAESAGIRTIVIEGEATS